MGKKYNYSFFKVSTFIKVNGDLMEQTTYSNLTYKQALSKFKEIRLKLESESLSEYIYLSLVGVTTEGALILKLDREFPCDSVEDSNIPVNEITFLNTNSEKELVSSKDEFVEPLQEDLTEDYSLYINNDDSVSLGDMIDSNLAEKLTSSLTFKEDDLLNNPSITNSNIITDNIDANDVSVDNADGVESIDCVSNIKSSMQSEENNVNYKSTLDVAPKETTKVTTLKDLKLSDYYRHISEVSSSDVIEILVQALSLLNEKHTYNKDMVQLVDKQRDCSYHDFEGILFDSTLTEEEKDKAILTIGKALATITVERRGYKNEILVTERAFTKLGNVRADNPHSFEELKSPPSIYSGKGSSTTKTYTYTYNTEAERVALRNKLESIHSKVVDVKWGVFECYNKCGSKKGHITNTAVNRIKSSANLGQTIGVTGSSIGDILVDGKMRNIPHVIELNSDDIIEADKMIPKENVVKYGSSFKKGKGSSVKILGLSESAFKSFVSTIHHKYTKIGYNKETCSTYLFNRIKK